MGRAAYIVGALMALSAGGPAFAETAAAAAHVTIIESGAVRVNWATATPSVRAAGDGGAAFVGAAPSTTLGMQLMPATSRLLVRREDPTGAPVTAPAAFEVVATPAGDAVIVRTASGVETSVARTGLLVGGALQGASAASIEVARSPEPLPGRMLSVVVQYN